LLDWIDQFAVRLTAGEFRRNAGHAPAVAYTLATMIGVVIFATAFRTATRRKQVGLSARSLGTRLLRAIVITIVLEFVVYYLNQDRGAPWMFGLFVAPVVAMNYAFTRTKWGAL
jgi:D-xylose transport system permease protein